MGKRTTYLMKVYLGKLCVSSNLIQCNSAIHVICLSFLETCARPAVTPDRAFNVELLHKTLFCNFLRCTTASGLYLATKAPVKRPEHFTEQR